MAWLFNPTTAAEQHNQSTQGMKEDLSSIGVKIGKQFRGVASFLAPPPSSRASDVDLQGSSPTAKALVGMRNDLAELGGSLKSGFSKFTSSFMAFKDNDKKYDKGEDPGEEDAEVDDYVWGISDEVILFVRELSKRPECWTDFPLPLSNCLRMSEAQVEHVSAISKSVPSIANLAATLDPTMAPDHFWFIYFLFLLPRLSESEFHHLSTPELIHTRDDLLHQIKTKREQTEPPSSSTPEITEIVTDISEADDNNSDPKVLDDISFSELEDYANSTRVRNHKKSNIPRAVSSSGSCDWVQFQDCSVSDTGSHKTRHSFSRDKDSDIESSDWLKVDESD